MTGLSQSAFLQALGWSTLSSIWQMAFLWCVFLGANYLFKLTAEKKYLLSVFALLAGITWFVVTFILYFNGYFSGRLLFVTITGQSVQKLLPLILTAAAVSYIILLFIPARHFFYNWRKVQYLKRYGLEKVHVGYKLFVTKIAGQLGIKKNIGIFFSDLVKSPLTVGYIKPIILLPLASVNNLTIQQVEAVILHELSHIKRLDYLVNILVSIIHTILYFNPFVRLLTRVVQEERENCCDQMVLQFGYDKVSYASALLSLEKTSLQSHLLVLGAAGKRNLLGRIEKIVGVEKKMTFQFNHFMGLVAALISIIIFNSLLITTQQKIAAPAVSFTHLTNPFHFFEEIKHPTEKSLPKQKSERIIISNKTAVPAQIVQSQTDIPSSLPELPITEPLPPIIQVAYNDALIQSSKEQAEHIKVALENTKKVLATYEWNEVEKNIGDGLTPSEKAAVKQEYLREVRNISWEEIEKDLQAAYDDIDWEEVEVSLNRALNTVRLDSLQKASEQTLKLLQKIRAESKLSSTPSLLPFPDESMDSIKKREEDVQQSLQQIQKLNGKKIIKL